MVLPPPFYGGDHLCDGCESFIVCCRCFGAMRKLRVMVVAAVESYVFFVLWWRARFLLAWIPRFRDNHCIYSSQCWLEVQKDISTHNDSRLWYEVQKGSKKETTKKQTTRSYLELTSWLEESTRFARWPQTSWKWFSVICSSREYWLLCNYLEWTSFAFGATETACGAFARSWILGEWLLSISLSWLHFGKQGKTNSLLFWQYSRWRCCHFDLKWHAQPSFIWATWPPHSWYQQYDCGTSTGSIVFQESNWSFHYWCCQCLLPSNFIFYEWRFSNEWFWYEWYSLTRLQRNDEYEGSSRAILLGGNLNAHSKLWDTNTKEDKLGTDIADYMNDFGFSINDGQPTYFASPHVRTSPDVTCCRGDNATGHDRNLLIRSTGLECIGKMSIGTNTILTLKPHFFEFLHLNHCRQPLLLKDIITPRLWLMLSFWLIRPFHEVTVAIPFHGALQSLLNCLMNKIMRGISLWIWMLILSMKLWHGSILKI